jgi:hypothetical protein
MEIEKVKERQKRVDACQALQIIDFTLEPLDQHIPTNHLHLTSTVPKNFSPHLSDNI